MVPFSITETQGLVTGTFFPQHLMIKSLHAFSACSNFTFSDRQLVLTVLFKLALGPMVTQQVSPFPCFPLVPYMV